LDCSPQRQLPCGDLRTGPVYCPWCHPNLHWWAGL